MKLKIIGLVFSLFAAANIFSQSYDSVIVRSDNDILTYADNYSPREAAPKVYVKELSLFLKDLRHKVDREESVPFKFIQTFRILTPDSNYVFAAMLDLNSFGMYIYLFYHDRKQNSCSMPYSINAAFMKNDEEGFDKKMRLMEKPYITFVDIDGDGKAELLLKRRAHNGTWNAVETKVLNLGTPGIYDWFKFNSREVFDGDITLLVRREIKSVDRGKITFTVNAYDIDSGRLVEAKQDETMELPK